MVTRPTARPGPAGKSGTVTMLPITGQQVLFVSAKAASSLVAAAFFDLKSGPVARARAATTGESDPVDPGILAVMAELGVDLGQIEVESLDEPLVRRASHVVLLGSSTVFVGPPGLRASVERWPLDEPGQRGITGVQRLRLIRDGIESNVNTLVSMLGVDASSRSKP